MNDTVKNVFVLAAGRSGSTLLDRLLGRHPDVFSLGEFTHLPRVMAQNAACSCGAPMHDCDFWQTVINAWHSETGLDLRRQPYRLDLGYIGAPHHRDPAYDTRWRRAGRSVDALRLYAHARWGVDGLPGRTRRQVKTTLALYDLIRRLNHAAVVVDSSKTWHKALALYALAPERTRLIVLVRDGRAVMHSRQRSGRSARQAVRAWRRYYARLMPLLQNAVPREHRYFLHYEDLASMPTAVLRDLCRFMGVEASLDLTEQPEGALHMTSGNDMRLAPLGEVRLDTRWQTGLSAADRRYFEKRGAAWNRRLGYQTPINNWRQFAAVVRTWRTDLLRRAPRFPGAVFVAGCQRSGTTMLADRIAHFEGMQAPHGRKDRELDAALILCGHRPSDGEADRRSVFQTTYLNEQWREYRRLRDDQRLIWVVRNPRSVVWSMVYHWKRFGLRELYQAVGTRQPSVYDRMGLWQRYRYRWVYRAAQAYAGKAAQVVALREQLGERLYVVDYDELVRAPAAGLERLAAFLGTACPASVVDGVRPDSVDKSAALDETERRIIDEVCREAYATARACVNSPEGA